MEERSHTLLNAEQRSEATAHVGGGGGKEHQDKTREARDEDIREPGVAGLL